MVEESPSSKAEDSGSYDVIDLMREQLDAAVLDKLKAEAKAAEYLGRLQRLQADLENVQKMSRREIENVTKLANEKLIVRLLPVLDSLEKAQGMKENEKGLDLNEMLVGIGLLSKELKKILEEEGLEKIDTRGALFDPGLHEAVSFVESNEHQDGAVVEELRAGYRLGGRVIRPSMVVVARKETAKQPPETG